MRTRPFTVAAKLVVLAVAGTLTAAGTAAAAPSIIGDVRDARCREALAMANTAFRSNGWSLNWPIVEPSDHRFRIILRQSEADISAGRGIKAERADFSFHDARERTGFDVYWRKTPVGEKRLTIADENFNWRGDWYWVFLVDAESNPDQLIGKLKTTDKRGSAGLKPLLGDNRWNPPLVLTDTATDTDWIIDRGERYEIMANWRVYVVTARGLTEPCRISFGDKRKMGLKAMPGAVRTFAAALDEALGPGANDGTLQQTAAIRLGVAQGWANAAIRPWAIDETPYNSRSEVDRGLANWARGSRSRTALMGRIRSAYPEAARVLSSYYESQLGMNSQAARKLGSHVIDQMFRQYFVFSKSSQ
jgi:hypothetical protein